MLISFPIRGLELLPVATTDAAVTGSEMFFIKEDMPVVFIILRSQPVDLIRQGSQPARVRCHRPPFLINPDGYGFQHLGSHDTSEPAGA